MNGFAQSLAAIGRMLGPMVGAPIFAWSESTGERKRNRNLNSLMYLVYKCTLVHKIRTVFEGLNYHVPVCIPFWLATIHK